MKRSFIHLLSNLRLTEKGKLLNLLRVHLHHYLFNSRAVFSLLASTQLEIGKKNLESK